MQTLASYRVPPKKFLEYITEYDIISKRICKETRSIKMSILFLEYPKCSTCKKAKKFLTDNNIAFEDRHIVENNPTAAELKGWIEKSGLPIKKFFNTSGNMYKELKLKDKLPEMTEDEQIALLSQNGMLVKRPLVIAEDKVLIGFKEEEWSNGLLR
jgi:arsenate reductase